MRFPLVAAIEALTDEGYVVLTAEQAEAVTALLGELVTAEPPAVGPWAALRRLGFITKAEEILATWPGDGQPDLTFQEPDA